MAPYGRYSVVCLRKRYAYCQVHPLSAVSKALRSLSALPTCPLYRPCLPAPPRCPACCPPNSPPLPPWPSRFPYSLFLPPVYRRHLPTTCPPPTLCLSTVSRKVALPQRLCTYRTAHSTATKPKPTAPQTGLALLFLHIPPSRLLACCRSSRCSPACICCRRFDG